MSTAVSCTIENGIAQIAMDDGKANAMSPALMGEINTALDVAEQAKAVAVLRGRAGIFSAGFDLKVFQQGPEASRTMVKMGGELILRLLRFPRPVMTVCTGHAYPMGAFLMLAADARWAVDGPWRIGLNETAIGLTVPQFAIELARHRLSAPGFARVSAAALMSPPDALRAGYVDAVVSPDRLDAAAGEEALRLTTLDESSFAATKHRVNERAICAISEALAAEFAALEGAAF